MGTGKEEESGVDTQSLDNEESYDEIIATLTQLIEKYEQLPENAFGAGSSLEKQEGNVHGYEQDEVTDPCDSFTTKETEIEEKDEEKSNIEVEEIENPTYIRNQDLVGDTKKVNVQLFCRYNSKLEGQKDYELPAELHVRLSQNRVLKIKFDNIKVDFKINSNSDEPYVFVKIKQSIIAQSSKYKIILRKNDCFKLFAL